MDDCGIRDIKMKPFCDHFHYPRHLYITGNNTFLKVFHVSSKDTNILTSNAQLLANTITYKSSYRNLHQIKQNNKPQKDL